MKWTSLLTALLFSLSVHADLEPRLVKKSGDVEIPPGMHLVRDRTGARWLLPEDMDTPPEREVQVEYYKNANKPRVTDRIGNHEVLDQPISALDAVVSTNAQDARSLMQRLPKAFAELMHLEKAANMHANTSNDLKSLGVFGPAEFTTFKVPYIPIPVEDMEFARISNYATPETRRLLEFEGTVNGKRGKFIRFFIHPNYVKSYADLISKFGIVYHYEGLSSSSPRSLIVMDPNKPNEVHWVKVSLHKKLDGSVRINTDKKARRAIIMSEAINEVPKNEMNKYGVSFMLEPAAFQPKGKIASTIHREVAPDLLNPAPGTKWIPAFILQNTGEHAVPGLNLEDMMRASRMAPGDFVRERIVRPLLRSYLAMGMKEGLPGELHTQNFYYELRQTPDGWVPTGNVKFKDNDGFRFDTELAMRSRRNLGFFSEFDAPFAWGKFSNALGTGAEGIPFIGSWYYKLIRNVNGFETLSAYMLRALSQIDPSGAWSKDSVQLMFDDIAAEEARKITGVEITRADYGYGADKGLNKIINTYRAQLSLIEDVSQKADAELQSVLKAEFERLRAAERVSALRRSVSKDAYFLAHQMKDGSIIIEARTPKTTQANPDPTIGFAMVESPKTQEGRAAHRRVGALLERYYARQSTQDRRTDQQRSAAPGRAALCRGMYL
jgi:hypothetical protein